MKAEDAVAPGDAVLREQRARREARYRERAIDTALEKVHAMQCETSVHLKNTRVSLLAGVRA